VEELEADAATAQPMTAIVPMVATEDASGAV
jgi:hypothetical protein